MAKNQKYLFFFYKLVLQSADFTSCGRRRKTVSKFQLWKYEHKWYFYCMQEQERDGKLCLETTRNNWVY